MSIELQLSLAFLGGVLVGVFIWQMFIIHVVMPRTAIALRETNMPKSYANVALSHYHKILDEGIRQLPDTNHRFNLIDLNNKTLNVLSAWIINPTSFLTTEENQNG